MQPGRPSRNALFPSAGQAVLLVVGMLVVQFGLGIGIGLGAALSSQDTDKAARFVVNPWTLGILNTFAIGGVLATGLRFTRERPSRFFRVRRFDTSLLPPIVLTAAGLAVVIDQAMKLFFEIMRLVPGLPVEDLSEELMATHPIGGFILVVAVAPFTEEYLFRGMILRGLLTRQSVWVAVLVSTLLFGVMHANVPQFLLGIVVGAVFGWWYVRTGSVGPGIVGHAVFNAVAYFSTVFPQLFAPLGPSTGPEIVHQPPWFTLTAVVFAGLGIWWFKGRADDLDALGIPETAHESTLDEPPDFLDEPAGGNDGPPVLPEVPPGLTEEVPRVVHVPGAGLPPLLEPARSEELPRADPGDPHRNG